MALKAGKPCIAVIMDLTIPDGLGWMQEVRHPLSLDHRLAGSSRSERELIGDIKLKIRRPVDRASG